MYRRKSFNNTRNFFIYQTTIIILSIFNIENKMFKYMLDQCHQNNDNLKS